MDVILFNDFEIMHRLISTYKATGKIIRNPSGNIINLKADIRAFVVNIIIPDELSTAGIVWGNIGDSILILT